MNSNKMSLSSGVSHPAFPLFNSLSHAKIGSMKINPTSDDFLLKLLRLGTFLCFIGWAWVHFYWEGPYAVLVWNQSTYSLAQDMGYGWEEVVGTGANDGLFQSILSQLYWGYLICAILAFTVKKGKPIQVAMMCLGFCMLTVLMYAKYLASKSQLPMLIEHGGQMLMPLILLSALYFGLRHSVTWWVAIVAFVTTFAGHGCYALGLWPTPSNFYGMTTVILGLNYETTTLFLRTAGLLDFIICVGVFIPRLRLYCVAYAVVWGLLTALARPVAGMSLELNFWGADQYIHESILRAPHYFIPLFLVLLFKKQKTSSS